MSYPNEDEGPDEVTWPAEHTPLPWVGFSDEGKLMAIMPAGRPGDVCTFAQSPSRPDGDLLLRSVNALPDLIAALEKIAAPGSGYTAPTHQAIARAALAKVKP